MASGQQKQPWQLTAAEALPLLRSGDLKAEDYVNSLLHRIQQRDEAVKAWVYLNPDQLIQQARHLDEVSAKARGPLHGLPVAVKDVILTKDMPTQYNSKLFESETPIGVDANCVMSLRAAGRYLSQVCTVRPLMELSKAQSSSARHRPRNSPPPSKAIGIRTLLPILMIRRARPGGALQDPGLRWEISKSPFRSVLRLAVII